jgi:adenosylcobinamide-phosphate synthase
MNNTRQNGKKYTATGSVIAILVACGLDAIGEPPASLHPVVWYGKMIRRLERYAPSRQADQLLYGGVMPLLGASVVLPSIVSFQWVVRLFTNSSEKRLRPPISTLLYGVLMGSALKPFFALRMLADAGKAVRLSLEHDDISAARDNLMSLVSRDRSELSESLIAAAAVESLAENMSDSVVAPLLYYACCGLPGAALYRLINTFDSMIGYHGKYEYLGKAAARLDDVLNIIPARLTALMIIACAPLYGGAPIRGLKIWHRDARKTESPNAGQPMSAAAGSLGIQLEKVNHYQLGDAERPVRADDIRRAEIMVWCVGGLTILLSMLCRWFLWGRGKYDHA